MKWCIRHNHAVDSVKDVWSLLRQRNIRGLIVQFVKDKIHPQGGGQLALVSQLSWKRYWVLSEMWWYIKCHLHFFFLHTKTVTKHILQLQHFWAWPTSGNHYKDNSTLGKKLFLSEVKGGYENNNSIKCALMNPIKLDRSRTTIGPSQLDPSY